MEQYSGKKNFKDFFAFLNMKNKLNKYNEIDSHVIRKFVDDFYPKTLPLQYIEFMKYAGNGEFWKGSSYKFSEVPELKKYAKELLIENDFPCKLKDDDFVFWMHGGYMFYFFNLKDGDDPPVYYYSECDVMTHFVKCSDKFTDFIINPYITGIPNP